MLDKIKKVNNVLRVVFIGFVVIYGIVRIFDVVPKKKERTASAEKRTSEFDELW